MSAMMEGARLRLMTYNIGGARRDSGSALDNAIRIVQENSPDILALQEAAEWLDAEQQWYSTAATIARALGDMRGVHFGPTLSMQEHFHVGKAIFVHGLFNDWLEWRQGNAILSRSGFVRLSDASKAGEPRNIPLFRPLQYAGNRDTDPRYALFTRIQTQTVSPFVIDTHLTTLRGERGGPEREIAGKSVEAREMRTRQVRNLIDLIQDHVLNRNELVLLMGDFNATANEACIAEVLETEAKFVRLVPSNTDAPTHLFKIAEPIDHIFVYPASRLIDYQCRIVDTPLARQASDHLPVVADVTVA